MCGVCPPSAECSESTEIQKQAKVTIPHAHILLTVRPLDEKGKWQYKTEKEYLCVKNGKEQGFTAAEFKQAQADGWEKQYQYKVGKKKVYMVPSSAQAQG